MITLNYFYCNSTYLYINNVCIFFIEIGMPLCNDLKHYFSIFTKTKT